MLVLKEPSKGDEEGKGYGLPRLFVAHADWLRVKPMIMILWFVLPKH